jgi:hypothetical protein
MTFEKSGLQVHDLNELETLGILDTAIQNASARRHDAESALSQAEADQVHGGLFTNVYIAGYFPVGPYSGFGPLTQSLDIPSVV